ncbi:MAG: PAS domain-containing protein [Thermoguttaceae bacterium]
MAADRDNRDTPELSRVAAQVNSLINDYVRNPEAPSHEELQRLLQDREAARMTLDAENKRLRKMVRQLEGYRDRYVDLYDFAPLAYVTLDDAGYIQEINVTGAELLGAPRSELTGYPFAQHVVAEEAERFAKHLRCCFGDQETCASELTLVARDGRRIPAQLRSLPVLAPDGTLFCKTAITDLTQRREMEEALRQSREFLQTVIDTIPDAVIVVGRNYRLILANRAAREMASGDDPMKCPACLRFLRQKAMPCSADAVCPLQEVLATKAPARAMQSHVEEDGTRKFYEIAAVPVLDRSGDVVRIIETCRDVSERQQVEEQLKDMNETLERRVAARTAVARRRADQLRALAAQLAKAEQRERHDLAEILRTRVEQTLIAATEKVDDLQRRAGDPNLRTVLAEVRKLLSQPLAEARALAIELSPPALYLEGLASALLWAANAIKRKYGLTVAVESQPGVEPTDEGTRVFLFEAVRELLLNIVQHAGADRASVTLARTDDGRIRLEVADEGKGFNPMSIDDREEIQDRFGLLAIRERLELMGGRLQIESHLGRGTRVVLLCPFGPPQRQVAARAAGAATSRANGRDRMRVVVADDHPTLRRGLADVLSEWPEIEIVGEAADGEEVVEVALETHPDAILMDVMMPKLGGVEATRRIVALLPKTRVIGLSGYEESDLGTAMRAAGAASYLPKGAPVEKLIEAIMETPAASRRD